MARVSSLTVWELAARPSQKNARTPAGKEALVGASSPPVSRGAVAETVFHWKSFHSSRPSPPGVLLGPEFRTESLRAESISSSPSPVLSTTPMTAGHSKTDSRDSYTQTEKGQSQESSKPSIPALQSMTLPARLSSTSPVYIPDRLAGSLCSPWYFFITITIIQATFRIYLLTIQKKLQLPVWWKIMCLILCWEWFRSWDTFEPGWKYKTE